MCALFASLQQLFPYVYPNILNPSYSSHVTAYEDGTECPETLAYKIQKPGITQKKAYSFIEV
jgi:hypothetical protein